MMPQPTWKPTKTTARKFNDMSIMYGGREGGALVEHAHSELQISVHFHGDGEHGTNASHVNVIASQQPHVGGWEQGNEIVVFQLSPELLLETRRELSYGNDLTVISAHETHDVIMEGLGHIVRSEFETPGRFGDFYIESVGHIAARHILCAHALIRLPEKQAKGLSDDEIRQLRRFVFENLHRGFSVRKLASSVKLGPALFAERLKSSTGLSPWRFVQDYRISAAKVLLKHRKLAIAEIAEQLGFADQSHLTNSFRIATGFTPKAFRSQTR